MKRAFLGSTRPYRLAMALGLVLVANGCASAAAKPTTTGVAPTTPTTPITRTRAEARRVIDSIQTSPELASSLLGILVVHPEKRDTFYAHNEMKMFLPASNMKLVTAASALALLGPQYRMRTALVARGGFRDGTVAGDLAILGAGDPSVSQAMRGDPLIALREMADSLWARGVRRIAGNVVKGGDTFSDANWGSGWYWNELDGTSGAGVDELMLNLGISRVTVRGGASPRAPVTASTFPARTFPKVRIEAVTGDSAGAQSRATVDYDETGQMLVVRGVVAPGDSTSVTIAYRDPGSAYLAALREAIEDRGIAVGAQALEDSATTITDTLLVVLSPPMHDIVRAMSKPSQNQIAEILLKTIGFARTGVGSAASGRRVIMQHLLTWDVPENGIVMSDGSGLSRNDLVSPVALAKVLHAMRRDTLFTSSLPVAGVDGTLRSRMRGTPAEGNVQAKTGTLARSRALSGYVKSADGERLIFSLLINNYTVSSNAAGDALDAIAAVIASMRWKSD